MPGVDPEQAKAVKDILEQIALLELAMVHPESHYLADRVASDPENEIVPGYSLKVYHSTVQDGKATTENILISRRPILDGSYVVHAQELHGPYVGQLTVTLNSEGADTMYDATWYQLPHY